MKKQIFLLLLAVLMSIGFASAVSSPFTDLTITRTITAYVNSTPNNLYTVSGLVLNQPDYIVVDTTVSNSSSSKRVFTGVYAYPAINYLNLASPAPYQIQFTYGYCEVYYDGVLQSMALVNIEAGHSARFNCRLSIPPNIKFPTADLTNSFYFAGTTMLSYQGQLDSDVLPKSFKLNTSGTAIPKPTANPLFIPKTPSMPMDYITWVFESNPGNPNPLADYSPLLKIHPDVSVASGAEPCSAATNNTIRTGTDVCQNYGSSIACYAFNTPAPDNYQAPTGLTAFEIAVSKEFPKPNPLPNANFLSGISIVGGVMQNLSNNYEYCFKPTTTKFDFGPGSFYFFGNLNFNYELGASKKPASDPVPSVQVKINSNEVKFQFLPGIPTGTIPISKQDLLKNSKHGLNDINVLVFRNGSKSIGDWLTAYNTSFTRVRIMQPGNSKNTVDPYYNGTSYSVNASETHWLGLLNVFSDPSSPLRKYGYKLELLTPGTQSEINSWAAKYVNQPCIIIDQRPDPPVPQKYQDFKFSKFGTYNFKASLYSSADCNTNSLEIVENLSITTQGSRVEISRTQFFQDGVEVEKYVVKSKPLQVKVTATNAGSSGFSGSVLLSGKAGTSSSSIAEQTQGITPPLNGCCTNNSRTFDFTIESSVLANLKESEAITVVAKIEKGADLFHSKEASFVIGKKAPASVPEMPLPLVLLILAGVLLVFKVKLSQSNNFK